MSIPILFNHDYTRPIGVWRDNGVGEFNQDQRVTKEQLLAMLGGAGVHLLELFEEGGTQYVRTFQVVEFSLEAV